MPIFNKIGDGRVGWLCWFDVEWPSNCHQLWRHGHRYKSKYTASVNFANWAFFLKKSLFVMTVNGKNVSSVLIFLNIVLIPTVEILCLCPLNPTLPVLLLLFSCDGLSVRCKTRQRRLPVDNWPHWRHAQRVWSPAKYGWCGVCPHWASAGCGDCSRCSSTFHQGRMSLLLCHSQRCKSVSALALLVSSSLKLSAQCGAEIK